MKLYAISDLHVGSAVNLKALDALACYPQDWLILAGDVGETVDHLRLALDIVVPRFERVFWVPGNHDLWAIDPEFGPLRGEMKYRRLVETCRSYGVMTPEDPYAIWPGRTGALNGGAAAEIVIAPLFVLYDHSFRPDHVAAEDAVGWARKAGVFCGDEELLDPSPHRSRPEWCSVRVQLTAQRLAQAAEPGRRLVLVNHFPLREDLLAPEHREGLSVWSGTRETQDWHVRFNAEAVVYGHLHLPATHMRDGVRFEEVSLGYPGDRDRRDSVDAYLRQILPFEDRH